MARRRKPAPVASAAGYDSPEDAVAHLHELLSAKPKAVIVIAFDEDGHDETVVCGDVARADVLWAGERLRRSAWED